MPCSVGSIRTMVPLDRSSEPFAATLTLLVRQVVSSGAVSSGAVSSTRSATSAVPIDVALWGRCPGHDENSNAHLEVGRSWTEVTVTFRFSAAVERSLIRPDGEPCLLQPEVYLRRPGATIELDRVSLYRRTVKLRT